MDEESLEVLLPSLKEWLLTKSGISELSALEISSIVSDGDEVLHDMLLKEFSVLNEYKLGWILLEYIVTNKKFKEYGLLTLQEKLFIRHLAIKYKNVLLELTFNINVLWRKCGCLQINN